jgi:hypothetical protein
MRPCIPMLSCVVVSRYGREAGRSVRHEARAVQGVQASRGDGPYPENPRRAGVTYIGAADSATVRRDEVGWRVEGPDDPGAERTRGRI